jgi:hypothetical protein
MTPCEQRDNVIRLRDDVTEIKEAVHGIEKTLYKGNGKPPIVSQLEVGNEKFSEIDRKLGSLDKKFDTLASYGRAVALAVLGFMGVIFWQMVQKYNADTYYKTSDKLAEVFK